MLHDKTYKYYFIVDLTNSRHETELDFISSVSSYLTRNNSSVAYIS